MEQGRRFKLRAGIGFFTSPGTSARREWSCTRRISASEKPGLGWGWRCWKRPHSCPRSPAAAVLGPRGSWRWGRGSQVARGPGGEAEGARGVRAARSSAALARWLRARPRLEGALPPPGRLGALRPSGGGRCLLRDGGGRCGPGGGGGPGRCGERRGGWRVWPRPAAPPPRRAGHGGPGPLCEAAAAMVLEPRGAG